MHVSPPTIANARTAADIPCPPPPSCRAPARPGTVKKKEHPVYGAFFKEVDPTVTATKLSFDSDSD